MPAYYEKGVLANTKSWHGFEQLHIEAEEGILTPEIALEKSGLDTPIIKIPVEYKGKEVDGKFFTVREQDDKVLGVVGSQYTVIQNREGFDFLTNLVDSDDIAIESAFSLKGGSIVGILARRPDHIKIAGEEQIPYIYFTNSHDGSSPIRAMTTTVRVVCWNTHDMAVRGAKNVHSVRHTRSYEQKLQAARETLQVSFKYTDEFAKMAEWLAETTISNKEFQKFLDTLVEIPKEEGRAKTIRQNRQDAIRDIYYSDDNLNNIRGTAWGALNSITQYTDWGKNYKDNESRFMSLTTNGRNFKEEATGILLEMSKG